MGAAASLVVTEFVLLAVICLLLMRYYKGPMVSSDVSLSVYLSWVLGLAAVLFLPYDLSVALVTGETSGTMRVVWRVVYWR